MGIVSEEVTDSIVGFVTREDGGNQFRRNVGPCLPSTQHNTSEVRSVNTTVGTEHLQNVLPSQSSSGRRAIGLRIFAHTRGIN